MLILKSQVHNLEVLLDTMVALENHAVAVAQSAFAYLQLVHHLWVNLSTVIHALFTFGLDYSNEFYLELPLKRIWKLQLMQKAVVKVHVPNTTVTTLAAILLVGPTQNTVFVL